jgi:hypothetical protein
MTLLLGVGEAQDSSISSVLKQTLVLGDRPIHVETLGEFHPVMGLRHCPRNLGNGVIGPKGSSDRK